jgi:6-phospho-beta-glucosidase
MKPLKIAVIGAGSTYTPELLDGFIRRKDRLTVAELRLMDIDEEKLSVISALAERMFKKTGLGPSLITTGDLDRALEGADYVIAQIRVGGLAARIRDEKIPLKYGLMGQETTGIGGMMNALRTIPVILDLARRMERLCPRATLINFSNPSGLVAEAVANRTTVRMWGLCNGPINMVRHLQSLLPLGVKNFDYDFVGLNHLCWITAAYADGVDMLPPLIAQGTGAATLKNIDGIDYPSDLRSAVPYLPVAYLNYFYFRNQELRTLQGAIKSRGEVVQEIEKELLTSYRDPNMNEKPVSLEKRGGALYSEAAVSLIEAVENDTGTVHVIDVPNRGSYDFMDDDDVVEVKCRIDAQGAHPIPLRGFSHPVVISLIRSLKAYEKLAARAALTGDRTSALGALLVHPLVGDYSAASAALDEMLLANRDYLPLFFPQT